jgi:hypothetical protein
MMIKLFQLLLSSQLLRTEEKVEMRVKMELKMKMKVK